MLLRNLLYFTVYAFSIVLQAVSTQSYFISSWKARVFGNRKLDQKVEYIIPSSLFKYRNGDRSGLNKQVFQIKVVDKKGNTVDWQNYLNLSICTDMVDTNMYHGSIGEETEDGEIVLFPNNEGKLEFIVKARKSIPKGWRVGIYPRCGDISQRKCGAGVPGIICAYKSKHELSFSHRHSSDYTGSDEDFMHSIEWDLSPRPTYWEKKENVRIKRDSEVCTITANELPPDEYYEERGILDYYLSLDWDYDDK